MAVITPSSITGSGQKAVTVTTLGASDTFVYNAAAKAVLYLNNITAGALTPLILGDAATEQSCAGVLPIDTSTGLTLTSIGIGDTVAIPLDSINGYLKGAITITGGDGIEVSLLEFK